MTVSDEIKALRKRARHQNLKLIFDNKTGLYFLFDISANSAIGNPNFMTPKQISAYLDNLNSQKK